MRFRLFACVVTVVLVCLALSTTGSFGQTTAEVAVSTVPSRITQRIDEGSRVVLRGNTHPMARAQFDRGLVASSLPMERIMMVLKRSPEQDAALASFNERQLDPASPDFHHWLTPEEFGAAYGPSEADIATVTGWLEGHGFQIYDVSKGRVIIQFSGTAAQVQAAFHVEMHNYLVSGKAHIANDRDPEIPQALSPVVAGIASLHNFFPVHQSVLGRYVTRDPKTHKITPVEGTPRRLDAEPGKLHPHFAFNDPNSGQSEDIAPYDFATIYNLTPLWKAGITGKGLSIAISAVTDLNLADITTFRKSLGLSAFAGTVKAVLNGTDPGVDAGSLVENTLDTEWSGAAAPDAQIIVVTSKSTSTTFGGMLSNQYIIDNKTAPIASASYGGCEIGIGTAGNSAINSLDQQGSTEGLSLFESSGDQGSVGCDNSDATTFPAPAQYGLQVNGDASSPYITAVGGTDFAWQTSPTSQYWNASNSSTTESNAIGYIPEIPWNATCSSTFLLQNAFTGEASSEQLCNDAAGDSTYDALVKVGGGSGGKSSCIGSTGGMFSSCTGGYPKPSWQKGTGVPTDGVRDVPDVSLFAAAGYPSGIPGSAYLICVSSSSPDKSCDYSGNNIVYQEVGGTSVSSPAMAGIMALVLQKVGGAGLGLANPVLYQLAATDNITNCNASTVTNGNSCIFYNVTTGTNAMVCTTGSINCVTNTSGDAYGIVSGYTSNAGYDLVTGLGSMNVNNLVNAWPTSATTSATLSPSSLSFPSTTVGTTSTSTGTVTLKNTGTTTITFSGTGISITGTNATSYSRTTTCGTTLASSATCTITVSFKPTAAGTLTGTLSVVDNAGTQTTSLTGTGATASSTTLTVTPGSLTFASTAVGSDSATQAITIKNTGTTAITLSGVTFSGSGASSFVRTSTTCSNPLAAGASCNSYIEFQPTTAGAISATLSVSSNAPTVSIPVTGTGAASGPTLTVTPGSLTFASTVVGSVSATQAITLKNTGGTAITLSGVAFSGSGASSFVRTSTTCSNPLAVGASCNSYVEFKPTTTGAISATLTVNSSAPSVSLPVSGTGAAAGLTLTVTPGSLTFASTVVGTATATQAITIKNTGSSAITLSGVVISGAGASSFTRTSTTCSNPLAAGASCNSYVQFQPTTTGAISATLTVNSNAPAVSISLSGTGVAAGLTLTVTPGSLTFPSTAVGVTSATQPITIKNTGSSAITLSGVTFSGTGASSFIRASTTCTNPLAAGASCTSYIEFKPTVTGALSATLAVNSNATGSPQTVAVSGTGK